jgi:putative ABC transport system permease protein
MAGFVSRAIDVVARRSPAALAAFEAAALGLSSIRAYKLRAGLTILGVVMGVMTVIGMSSVIGGLNASMAAQIQSMGSSVILIKQRAPGENVSREERRRRRALSLDEVEAISRRCPAVAAVAPLEWLLGTSIKYQGQLVQNAQLFGVTPDYQEVHDIFVSTGRFVGPTDVTRAAAVAVIGIELADQLFPNVDPLGKVLTIEGRRFEIVGVLEKRGKFLMFNRDNQVLIPLGSLRKRDRRTPMFDVDCKAASPDQMDAAVEQIHDTLRRERKLRFWQSDTFAIFTQDVFQELYTNVTSGIYMVMIAISSIGLVVGGVGVMNIMLVSITERTREIGVRKALGATRRSILWQFLTEAMFLTGLGGVLGILVGGAATLVINAFSPFPALLQPTWVAIGLLTSMAVGLIFGLWPAAKAARLDPIAALRYE